jgi:type IV pilus biogenesis protein PilP
MMKMLLALPFCLATVAAVAQSVPNEQLSQVKSETILLKAKADEAAALKAVSDSLPHSQAGGGEDHSALVSSPEEMPTIIGVFGPRGATYAKIALPDGRRVNVRTGEPLPGGKWRVVIRDDEVRLIPAARGER